MAATTIKGTALAAGVSRNNRMYTPEVIAQAVAAAQPAIAAGTLLMRAGHDTPDVSGIAGRVTKLAMSPDGQSAQFEAALLDTAAGRDAQLLTAGPAPHVGVSIVGQWIGRVHRDAKGVESAPGLELIGLDLTGNPGVPAARIVPEAYRRAGLITETAPAPQVVVGDGPNLAAMTGSQLGSYLAAGYLAQDATPGTATPTTSVADVIRAEHAGRLATNRGDWLAANPGRGRP